LNARRTTSRTTRVRTTGPRRRRRRRRRRSRSRAHGLVAARRRAAAGTGGRVHVFHREMRPEPVQQHLGQGRDQVRGGHQHVDAVGPTGSVQHEVSADRSEQRLRSVAPTAQQVTVMHIELKSNDEITRSAREQALLIIIIIFLMFVFISITVFWEREYAL